MRRHDTRPPPAEGRRHLRLGGAPALAAAAAARARLGRADADAARERAGRLGLRPRARGARRAARRDPAARRTSTRSRSCGSPATSRAHRPAILHTHLVHADAYGQMAGMLARVPVRFSTKHGFNEFREGRAFALGDRTVASLAHVHIAISRGLARYLADDRGLREESFEIVHYGIDARTASRRRTPTTVPRLLCVGRLIPIKGHIVLLRAFAAAKRRCPGSSWTSPAAGRSSRRCRRSRASSASPTPCASSATWRRSRARSSASAIVVVPSMGEGFGMVALEAMERARPVIAAEIGGLGELVRDGETGLLVAARRGGAAARGDRPPRRRTSSSRGRDGRGRPAGARCATSSSSAASTGPRSSTRARSSAPPEGQAARRARRA